MMSPNSRPVALVTGASAGIGRDLAELCASDGHDVVVVARSEGPLRELASELQARYQVTVHVMVEDLADPEGPARVADNLTAKGIELDVLINNAGTGVYGPFVETDLDQELASIRLNVMALTHLTKLIVRQMVRRGRGRILNVASTAAFQPGPLMAVYYGTKAYVLSLSEALANELRGTGVTVTVLCPGPTKTGFQARAGMTKMLLVAGPMMATSRDVARAGYERMKRGKTVVIPGLLNKLLVFAIRLAPRWVPPLIVRQLQKRRG